MPQEIPPHFSELERSLVEWLERHSDRFAEPFHALAGMLLQTWREARESPPMTTGEYADIFSRRVRGSALPFRASEPPRVDPTLPIDRFVEAWDLGRLDHMIHGNLVGLIRHLAERPEGLSLLDYGTGTECGLYGQANAALWQKGEVPLDRVEFTGIDKFCTPQNSAFKRADYQRVDLLDFDTGEQFDLISAHHVLEHCARWREVISRAAALLRPGGFLWLSYPTFGGFYDTVYRLMTRTDHVATFHEQQIRDHAIASGFELAWDTPYVDPRMRFFWLPSLDATITPQLQSNFYDLCAGVSVRSRIFFHHYGTCLVLRRC